MKTLKENFAELFTLMAWITLLLYIFYCTYTHNTTDSIRDAWNVIILIAGFVWGSQHKKTPEVKTTTELTADGTTITTEPAKTTTDEKPIN